MPRTTSGRSHPSGDGECSGPQQDQRDHLGDRDHDDRGRDGPVDQLAGDVPPRMANAPRIAAKMSDE